MMQDDPSYQLVQLASDDAGSYEDAWRWFLSRGAAMAPVLVEALDNPRLGSAGHWRILLILRELRLSSTLPAILKAFRAALASDNPIVLPGALEALAVFDADEAWDALISALDARDADVVNHAAALLAQKGGRRAENAVAALLRDPGARRRQSAVAALLKMNTESARDILRRHREYERDPSVLKLLERLK